MYKPSSLAVKRFATVLAVLIGINGLIVLIAHMAWETNSSITLRKELSNMQLSQKPIEIDYGWFKKSMEEKLNRKGIKYKPVKGKQIKKTVHKTLTSVVQGYPNMVIWREGE